MKTTILLVDDHPVFRQGLRHLLEKEKDLKVVGEAGDGEAALDMVRKFSPDVVVMDITMPNIDGIEAVQDTFPSAILETKTLLRAANLPSIKVLAHNLLNDIEGAKEPLCPGAG